MGGSQVKRRVKSLKRGDEEIKLGSPVYDGASSFHITRGGNRRGRGLTTL